MLKTKEPGVSNYEVGAVRKALEMLCRFSTAQPSHTVSDLSRMLDMPKSTAHNLLRTLVALDFLRQDSSDRCYRLGPRVFELGSVYSHKSSLTTSAYPYMRKLVEVTKETVKIGVPSSGDVVILAAIESPFQLHTRGDAGVRAPLHCTGLGKAILSTFGDDAAEKATEGRGLRAMTPKTITNLEDLLADLRAIRKHGYALDLEENEAGVVCAAAPIFEPTLGITAALSVSGPATRMTRPRLKGCAELVARTSKLIAASLRGVPRGARRNSNEEHE